MKPSVCLGVLFFSGVPTKRLEEEAASVVPPELRRVPGASEDRYRAYLAGRVASSRLFAEAGLDAWVVPDPKFGFLTVKSRREVSNYFLNISHTAEVAVAALATAPVGVDVESIHRSAENVLTRVASRSELEALQKSSLNVLGDLAHRSIAIWSAKEAVSKATGLGIIFGLLDFRLDFSGGEPLPVALGQKGPQRLEVPGIRFYRTRDYLVSVCTESSLLKSPPRTLEVLVR